jgi:nitrogen regulatory protein P-II 1
MKKIEAVIRRFKLEAVQHALVERGIHALTVTEVRGSGGERPHIETYRGLDLDPGYLPRLKIEVVIEDELVEAAIDAILLAASTGHVGDGKIFVSRVETMLRIRTGEELACAV